MAKKPILELLDGVTRFGRLTVLAEAEPYHWNRRSYRMALCRCDCGAEKSVQPGKLKSGQTLSCGCLARERAAEVHRTHGMTHSPEYRSWLAMRNRCYREDDISFHIYGGRGISVCERWRDCFEAFYEDMGPRPPGMTLDRIEAGRNYEPANCRWATPREQADNTRVARKMLVDGSRINLSEAARRSGLSRAALRRRMRQGMPIEAAMVAPIDKTQGSRHKSNNRVVEYRGRRMLLVEVADATGIEGSHLRYHLKRGRTMDEAVEFISSRRKSQ